MRRLMTRMFIAITLMAMIPEAHAQKVYVVDQGHKKASDQKGKGTVNKPFLSISKAASLAGPGDTVLVFSGEYRERVAPARGGEPGKPVVYMAAPNETVTIKGSDTWKNSWIPDKKHPGVYRSALPLDQLESYNPFYIPLARMKNSRYSLGQIFCNGERYMQVDSLQELAFSPGTWMMSYDSTAILLHFKPENSLTDIEESLIEFSVRDKVFAPHTRGLGYITVEGFIIEHCANQFPSGFYHDKGHPQAGALSTRSGNHWVIRRNKIRHAKNLGIDCGYEGVIDLEGNQPMPPKETIGFHLIEYNTIEDNGCGGIAGAQQKETTIRRNTFKRNGYLGIPAPENGVIKVHFFYDGLIEENLLMDNYVMGIWLDNQWYGTRVTSNTILNTNGPGIFVEMGNGPCLIDNNIIAYSKAADGIYLHDASGVTIANNLLYCNAHFGFYARIVTERNALNAWGKRELVATKDLTIMNNIFIDNYRGHISLPYEDGDRIANNRSDYNLFINGTQWQWEGLAFNSFNMGSNDRRIDKDNMKDVLRNALVEHNHPDSLMPNFTLWKEQPLLRFDWWQKVYQNDLNSFTPEIHTGVVENGAIEKGMINFSSADLRLEIRNGRTISQYTCPRIKEVDRDFFGNIITNELVHPGPFQHYNADFNRFRLKHN